MAIWLYKLGRAAFRHKWMVISAWVVVLIVFGGLVGFLKPTFATNFELPGTDSDRAMSVMKEDFPAANDQLLKSSTSILVAADDGLENHMGQIDALVAKARTLPKVIEPQTVVNPVTAAKANPAIAPKVLGDNGKVGLIQIKQDIRANELTNDDMTQFENLLAEFRGNGLQVEGTGSLMQVFQQGGVS